MKKVLEDISRAVVSYHRSLEMNRVAAAKKMVRKLTMPHKDRSPIILNIGL